jgi:hypothetical protein
VVARTLIEHVASGTKRTNSDARLAPAFGGKAEVTWMVDLVAIDPTETLAVP